MRETGKKLSFTGGHGVQARTECLGLIPLKDLFCGGWCEVSFPGSYAPLESSWVGGCSPLPPAPPTVARFLGFPLSLPQLALWMSGRVFLKVCGYGAPCCLLSSPCPRAWLGMAKMLSCCRRGVAREEKRGRTRAFAGEVYGRGVGFEGMSTFHFTTTEMPVSEQWVPPGSV